HGCGELIAALPSVKPEGPAMASSPSGPLPAMPIDVVSDVVCPWCFIGKRRLEKALALTPDIPVDVHWRPYFLNDWVPREGIDRNTYLETKFGSVERYNGMAKRVQEAAAAEGLVYALDKIARQPNTLDCHRLILRSEEHTSELQSRGHL